MKFLNLRSKKNSFSNKFLIINKITKKPIIKFKIIKNETKITNDFYDINKKPYQIIKITKINLLNINEFSKKLFNN